MAVGVSSAVLIVLGGLVVMTIKGHVLGQSTVTATRDIEAGEKLVTDSLTAVTLPSPALANTVPSIQPVLGRIALSRILKGDPVRSERLAHPGRRNWTQSLTAPGARTVWITMDDGADGLGMLPGDRLDVWASFAKRSNDIQTVSVAKLVQVIHIEPSETSMNSVVTVAASAEQVETITKYRTDAQLHLVLRSDRETTHIGSTLTVEAHPATAAPRELHAQRDLMPGAAIEAQHLVLRIGTGIGDAGFTEISELVGAIPHSRILAGERIVDERLADAQTGRGVAALIAPGDAVLAVEVGENIDDFTIGSQVTAMNAIPGRRQMQELATDLPILGHHLEGRGCPCIQLVIDAEAIGPLVQAKAMNRLALSLPK